MDQTLHPAPKRRSSTLYRGEGRDQRVAARRVKLIDAAIACFGTKGYHATSVRELCAAAGLSERYFYESFLNREALLLAAFEHCSATVIGLIEAAMAEAPPMRDAQIAAGLSAYFAAAAGNPAATRLTLVEIQTVSPEAEASFRSTQSRITGMIAALMTQASAPSRGQSPAGPKPDPELLSTALASAFNGLSRHWVDSGFARPAEEMVACAMALYRAISPLWQQT